MRVLFIFPERNYLLHKCAFLITWAMIRKKLQTANFSLWQMLSSYKPPSEKSLKTSKNLYIFLKINCLLY